MGTFFNLINNYVGMVLLSMHFCFARSGWLALPLLTLLTAFGAFTGDCLVESYKTIQADNPGQAPSFAEIGSRCVGPFGKWLVVVSSFVENFFALFCMLIITWANAQLLLPSVDPQWVVTGCIALSFPTNWLRDFSLLSFLSAFGLGCVLLIIAVVVFDASHTAPNMSGNHVLADLSGLPMSGSIMLAGLTGHVGLPPMYADMRTPTAFRTTLYLSFLAMLLMYGAVGVCGYLLYGSEAQVLITSDMAAAAGSDQWAQALVYLVLGSMTFKLFCGVPVCVLVVADICEDLYLERHGRRLSDSASDALRVAIWTFSVVCALVMAPWLQYVTALVGINSMLISVLLPLLFYVQLHRKGMDGAAVAAFAALLTASCAATIFICYADVLEFLQLLADQPDR